LKTINAVIDRIEDGGVAVLLVGDDEKTQIDLPVALLPEGVAGGDHLKITITQERSLREAAEARVKKLQDRLTESSGTQDQKDFKL
jgi:autonomous glycyl radical cofactor GrcA